MAMVAATPMAKFDPPASNSKNLPPFVILPLNIICLIVADIASGITPHVIISLNPLL